MTSITITIPALVVRLIAVAMPSAAIGGLVLVVAGVVEAVLATTTALGALSTLYLWLFTRESNDCRLRAPDGVS